MIPVVTVIGLEFGSVAALDVSIQAQIMNLFMELREIAPGHRSSCHLNDIP